MGGFPRKMGGFPRKSQYFLYFLERPLQLSESALATAGESRAGILTQKQIKKHTHKIQTDNRPSVL